MITANQSVQCSNSNKEKCEDKAYNQILNLCEKQIKETCKRGYYTTTINSIWAEFPEHVKMETLEKIEQTLKDAGYKVDIDNTFATTIEISWKPNHSWINILKRKI